MVKSAGKDFAQNYPSTTFKNFIINAPAASIAGPVVNAMLPARSRDKNVLHGSKYAVELHAFVSPANLPQKLGGSIPDGVQWRSK